ncbi:CHASE4 domain-containing protein [Methanoculleus frigidifontis]|nr:CHASE4 domain-containing protein [Methanoculleus sp. FWC-SCC1]
MNLLTRTLIIIALALACLMGTLILVSDTVLLESYAALEQQEVTSQVHRAASALENEIATIDTINEDWAAWDDTYAFIDDENDEYIASNLVDATFTGLGLNLMLYADTSGEIVHKAYFDLAAETALPLPDEIAGQLTAEPLLTHHPDPESSAAGIIKLPGGLMLISSRPIITSNDEGPVRGALIMGRFLDDDVVADIAETTHLSLRLLDPGSPGIPEDVVTGLQEAGAVAVHPGGLNAVSGYTLASDLHGTPAAVLAVDMPRAIFQQGIATVTYMVLLLLIAAVVFGLATIYLLQKNILSRVALVDRNVTAIGSSGDFSSRLRSEGDDEITGLTDAINGMLGTLEHYHHHLEDLVRERTAEVSAVNAHLKAEIAERRLAEEELEKYKEHLERKVEERTRDLYAAAELLRMEIEERKALEAERTKAFEQIELNMEQFATLNDHIRNPLQVIVGIASLDEENASSTRIIEQAMTIDEIIKQLDRGWIESEKIRAFLKRHY